VRSEQCSRGQLLEARARPALAIELHANGTRTYVYGNNAKISPRTHPLVDQEAGCIASYLYSYIIKKTKTVGLLVM
jgi:hypothetical protein